MFERPCAGSCGATPGMCPAVLTLNGEVKLPAGALVRVFFFRIDNSKNKLNNGSSETADFGNTCV